MKKIEVLRNKMVLGCLTLGDLCKIIRFEDESAELSVGIHWLPVVETKIKKSTAGTRDLQIFMDSNSLYRSSTVIPMDCFLKINENLIFINRSKRELSPPVMPKAFNPWDWHPNEIKFRLKKNIFEKLNFR